MEWYQLVSCFLTNEIRLILGICLVVKLLKLPKVNMTAVMLSFIGSLVTTALTAFEISQFYIVGIEIVIIGALLYYLYREEIRMSIFLIFFYEIGVALWEFLISAGIGILLKSDSFVKNGTIEHNAAVWPVRLLMIAALVLIVKKKNIKKQEIPRFVSAISFIGMFGVIALSEQSMIALSDDELTMWIILSLLLSVAILFFNVNRQYEMEKEIVKLKSEQAKLVERDYQSLNKTYSANAKLYHDIHNHIEVLHRYLQQGETADAIRYLEDLRTPVSEITQTIWTGDKAIDYLINSKIAFAEKQGVKTKVNIEYPRHTNIRSVDLTAILGNLLDNAMEASTTAPDELRFIEITIRRVNYMLIIKVENGFGGNVIMENDTLQTSKTDKDLHGWGLKSAYAAVDRYDGAIEITCNNHIFQTIATLSFT